MTHSKSQLAIKATLDLWSANALNQEQPNISSYRTKLNSNAETLSVY